MLQAAHVALLRDDWSSVSQAFAVARRTVVDEPLHVGFTAVYNLPGLWLAALGFLLPVLAAAA